MYSKQSWGGSVDPFIQVFFQEDKDAGDAKVGLVIFEFNDKDLLGIPIGDGPEVYIYTPLCILKHEDSPAY